MWNRNTGALNTNPMNMSQKIKICWESGIGTDNSPGDQMSRHGRGGA